MLRRIFDATEISRADLAREIGLARSTVSEIVAQLLRDGIVRESHRARSRGGRPPIVLRLEPRAGYMVGFELGTSALVGLVTDLRGNVIAETRGEGDFEFDPSTALAAIHHQFLVLLRDAGIQPADVFGIGIAVPCPLRPDRPDELSPRILPAWQDVRLGAVLHERTNKPIFVENDANLGALAERWWGRGRGLGDFAFVKLSTGVGAGLIVDGEIYTGATGIAGEIGHTAIDPKGPQCRCGLTGCLEAVIGLPALIDRAGVESIGALLAAGRGGDPDAVEALESTGRALGVAIANLVNLLNPRAVVLSGPLTAAGKRLTIPLQQTLRSRALWTSLDDTDVVLSALGDHAVARGAATMVLNAVLTDPLLLRTRVHQTLTA